MVMVSMPEEDGTARKYGLNGRLGRDGAAFLWDMIRQELKPGLRKATYEAWVKPTKGIKFDHPTLVVESPTAFSIDWLERRLRTQIDKTARQVAGEKLKVRFKVSGVQPYIQQPPKPTPKHMNPDDGDGGLSVRQCSDVVTVGDLFAMGGPLTQEILCSHAAPDDPVAYQAWLRLRRAQAGEIERQQGEDVRPAEYSRVFAKTHRERDLLDVSDSDVLPIDERRQIGSGREAPGGPVDYPAWLHRKRELLERRSRVASLSGFDREDRRPVLRNLAYPKGLDILHLLPGLLREGSVKNPGIVIASYPNLQAHIRIEHPDGRTAIVDRDDFCDGGEVIWTDRGTAILKDLQTGVHCAEEVDIKGMSTKGFCLLRPPGLRDYTWFAPRQPESEGGQNRPTRLTDGTSFQIYAVESINVDADVLSEYTDISGVVVKLQAAERSPGRHREQLGLGH